MSVVVIGVGNPHRRDDGVGPVVAEQVAALKIPGVRVLSCAAEPTALLDAWTGAGLAVLVDAVAGPLPGSVQRCRLADLAATAAVSSHDVGLVEIAELGRALDCAPGSIVVVAVGVADTGHGCGLSAPVAAALPEAVRVVRSAALDWLAEQVHEPAHQQT